MGQTCCACVFFRVIVFNFEQFPPAINCMLFGLVKGSYVFKLIFGRMLHLHETPWENLFRIVFNHLKLDSRFNHNFSFSLHTLRELFFHLRMLFLNGSQKKTQPRPRY